jgi:Uma2 family endonuclease
VVEVAVTTHSHDAWKAQRYARAGVGEYWIVDLPGRGVTVHRGSSRDGYEETARHGEDDRIPTDVGAPAVDVRALLGRPRE